MTARTNKPCPFCGGTELELEMDVPAVRCANRDCLAMGPDVEKEVEDLCWQKWNERAAGAP